MDKKEFETRLAQLVDFEYVVPKVLRDEKLDGDAHQQVFYEGTSIEIDRDHNPTLGIRITKLKPKYAACELGCGDVVANQVIQKMYNRTLVDHWRTKCATCGKYVHPSGEGFIKSDGTSVSTDFSNHFRKVERDRNRELTKQSKPRG
jgi:hypothetical protein